MKQNLDYIETGDLIFLVGKTWMAKQIRKSQKAKGNQNWRLNHVGIAARLNGELCVFEEDYPGKFGLNRFKKEYIDTESEVYVGTFLNKSLTNAQKQRLINALIDKQGEDRWSDYAFWDIPMFKLNSMWYKWTKRDTWFGRKKNKNGRYSCSQISALYIQKVFNLCEEKSYLEWSPADIADLPEILLRRIKF